MRALPNLRSDTALDVAAVLFAVAFTVPDLVWSTTFRRLANLIVLALYLAAAGILWWRRSRPVLVACAVSAVSVGIFTGGILYPSLLSEGAERVEVSVIPGALPFAAYAVVAFLPDRRRSLPSLGILVASTLLVTQVGGFDPRAAGQSLPFLVVPIVLALYLTERRRLFDARMRQALVDDRSRIATEMHDVITHRVSLMVLQAGALQVTAPDDATRTTAEELRSTGCEALGELRGLVRVLHDADPGESLPGMGNAPIPELRTLIAESRSIGIEVSLIDEGGAVGDPVVARTVHRIVQEALTNVRKHAPGSRVEVVVRRVTGDAGSEVDVRVQNTEPLAGRLDPLRSLTEAGAGTGLAGLRQRVEMIGGTLRAAPQTDGGFQVRALLPLSGGSR